MLLIELWHSNAIYKPHFRQVTGVEKVLQKMYITYDRLNYMDVIIGPEPTRGNKSVISFGEEISTIFTDHQIIAFKYVIINTVDCTCCSIIIVVSMLVFSLFFGYGAALAVVICNDISEPHPLPRIGDVKRYFIRK